MAKAPQKAKDIVCKYLQTCAIYASKKGKLKGEIASDLLKKDPKGFPERIYNLAIDDLVNDKKINKIYSYKSNASGPDDKLRKDLPDDVSGWLYWIKIEAKK